MLRSRQPMTFELALAPQQLTIASAVFERGAFLGGTGLSRPLRLTPERCTSILEKRRNSCVYEHTRVQALQEPAAAALLAA